MCNRIARHLADRAERLPGVVTVEEPLALAEAIRQHSAPGTLVVVDCLTLWLTNLLMPLDCEKNPALDAVESAQLAIFLGAIVQTPGPVVWVSNEIGLGVIPMGPLVRDFVDTLGRLNQQVAQRCHRVTLMVAGLPLVIKDAA
jgi:adenosylcobinamide kinase/adenosylcobinamide-phosphate guanylyltransferase